MTDFAVCLNYVGSNSAMYITTFLLFFQCHLKRDVWKLFLHIIRRRTESLVLITGREIRYILINNTWHFFPLLCNQALVRHWAVTSMLYHSTWFYSERTWQWRAALPYRLLPLPTFSLCSVPLCSFLNTGVSWVYYLPPPAPEGRGGAAQKVGLLPGLRAANTASKVSVRSRSQGGTANTRTQTPMHFIL